MSHETGVDSDGKGINTSSGDDSNSFRRRGFLKAAGVATAGALLSTASQAVAASSHPKGIIFDGSGTSATSEYAFTASASVEKIYDSDDNDVTISGGSASGSIGDSIVAFGYAETLTELDMTGPASILLGPEIENELPDPADELIITADGEIAYEFTTTGEITKLLENGRNSAEANNDTVVQNDDGTWTASGYTGNGYGDGFTYRGDVTSFTPQTGAFELYRNGESTTTYELTGTEPPSGSELVIRSDGEIAYEFTTSGEISKLLDNGRNSAEANNDTVVQNDDGTWTASGYTGNGYGDGFSFEGEVTEFSPMDGSYTLELDGKTVSAYELTGTEPPADDGSTVNVGGGTGYSGKTYTESDGDYVVSTRQELLDAADSAGSGDVIFVDGDATIDIANAGGGAGVELASGVTVASNRGVDGAPGALLTESALDGVRTFRAFDNNTFAGIRLRGPSVDKELGWDDGYSAGEILTYRNQTGIWVEGDQFEVANCKIRGFGYNGVYLSGTDNHIHHSVISDNKMTGWGYGINHGSGATSVVESCRLNRNRHCIAGHGDAGYTARNNVVGPKQASHAFDHHGGGGETEIHNNRFENTTAVEGSAASYFHKVDHDGPIRIHNNWFYNPDGPGLRPPSENFDNSIVFNSDTFDGTDIRDNHYGTDSKPPSGVGLPNDSA